MEVPQNLGLKNATQISATYCLRYSRTPSTAECSETFSHLAPTVGSIELMTATSSTSSSTIPATGSEMNLVHNNHLLSIILKLHKQQQRNLNSYSELATEKGADSCIRQLLKKATTTKDDERWQKTATPIDVSAKVHCAADPKRQFQYGSECAPTGYMRYRVKENCGYEKCNYRHHHSHFHCNRADCGSSFSDRTRFGPHSAKHERIDAILGSDFVQYRTKMNCNYTNCPYSFKAAGNLNKVIRSRKSSHFHCLKCPYACPDINKVTAHRHMHSKMEFLRLAGFRKVTAHENCMILNNPSDMNKDQQNTNNVISPENFSGYTLQPFDATCTHQPTFDTVRHCPYVMRYTHYHCLVCDGFVLSKSKLLSHKHRNPLVSHTNTDILESA